MSELQKKHHSLTYTEGTLSVGGVEEVLDYDDKHMRLSLGERTLLIEGQGLKIDALDVDSGTMKVRGVVDCFRYGGSAGGKSLLKKLFR